MSNSITEGKDRELAPDQQSGEIKRVPTSASVDLKVEVLQASTFKEAGQGDAMRERSSIESRTDLRIAATNEAMLADPSRGSATLVVEQEMARRWADLDAADFGRIRSDSRREAALESISGHVRASPEYADELKKRMPVLAEAAKRISDERDRVERQAALPAIERSAATLSQPGEARSVSEAEQREKAQQDAKTLSAMPPGGDRQSASVVVGESLRHNPAYHAEMQRVAPQLVREASIAVAHRDDLRSIERSNDALHAVPVDTLSVAEAREAVRKDLETIRQLNYSGDRYQAAIVMGDSARAQGNYRAELELQAPNVSREVKIATAENDLRNAEKEERKAAELAALRLAKGDQAAAWTPEQAADQVKKDSAALRTADVTERYYAIGDAAIAVSRSPAYAEALAKESPELAREVEARRERDEAARLAIEKQRENIDAAQRSRSTVLDSAALAAVAAVRATESARVARELGTDPGRATQERIDARDSLKAPPLDGRVTAPDDPDLAAQRGRAIKRPVDESALSAELLAKFIVSAEKRGILDRGTTEFTFRTGAEQGRVSFVDVGKSLSTQRDDQATVRAMVEVASVKNWKEITVSGSDDFRRQTWLEAGLNGIAVRGYEPREADKKLLDELRQRDKPTNVITAVEREHKREEPREPSRPQVEPAAQRKHIDGDALTPHEKTVLDNSRQILDSKALGEQFTQAALRELEVKLRGERVYVGEIVDHGRAPYKFDKENDESYYVTLRTRAGDQVIWGKGLAEAMQERSVGEQVVLQNIGKRDVTVQERMRDAQGQVVGSRPKESQLNAWKAELLSRFNDKARRDFQNRSASRQPTIGVYDSKAPRPEAKTLAEQSRTPEQQRNAEQQRNSRER